MSVAISSSGTLALAGGHTSPCEDECAGCGHARMSRRRWLRADFLSRSFDLHTCARCGLVEVAPREAHRKAAASGQPGACIQDEKQDESWTRAVEQYVVHLLPHEIRRSRRLLHLGCGRGHLAALARRRGWRVMGLDMSPEAVSRAVAEFDLDVRAGPLHRYRGTLPPFDFVLDSATIESEPDPGHLLREVRATLTPDGLFCIETPNRGGVWQRLLLPRRLEVQGARLHCFGPRSLGALLRRCGFDAVQVGSYCSAPVGGRPVRARLGERLRGLGAAVTSRLFRSSEKRRIRAGESGRTLLPPVDLETARKWVDRLGRGWKPTSRFRQGTHLVAAARRG